MTKAEIDKAAYEARVKMTVQANRCGAAIVGNAYALHHCWDEMSNFGRQHHLEKLREELEVLNHTFTSLTVALSAAETVKEAA